MGHGTVFSLFFTFFMVYVEYRFERSKFHREGKLLILKRRYGGKAGDLKPEDPKPNVEMVIVKPEGTRGMQVVQPGADGSLADKLQHLEDARAQGLLSAEEHQELRTQLLSRFAGK